MPKKQRHVEVRGLCVYLVSKDANGHREHIYKRKLVSPEWIDLFFKIKSGEFDQNLWIALPQVDKDFLAYCIHEMGLHHTDFEIALARDYRGILERMRVLEGSIKAGNLNDEIATEFKSIIDRLTASSQLSSKMGTSLKNQLDRSIAYVKESKRT